MKGKVLGFDIGAGTGAITGDDGNRYAFTAAENKSATALKAGDTVDFQIDGSTAKDIYVVAGGASVDFAALASDPTVGKVLARPYVIWAAIIILGSLVGGYFGTLNYLNQITGSYGSGLGLAALLAPLLFAIPIIAGVLIFFEFTNSPLTVRFRTITAAAAIGGPILIPLIAGMFAPRGYVEIMNAAGAGGHIGLAFTPGMLITVAGGVLIILTQIGIVKLSK